MISSPPFSGIDPEHWRNSAWIVAGDVLPRMVPDGARGIVRLLIDRGRCLRADHTRRGALDCAAINSADLSGVAAAHDAGGVIAFEADLTERLLRRAADGLRPEMDLNAQTPVLIEAARAELGAGIRIWPEIALKPARPVPLNTAVKTALPAGELLVMVVYSEDGKTRDSSGAPIVTSGILRFDSRPRLDLCATTAALPGLAIRDWRADWQKVNDATRRTFGKIFVAVHLPDAVLPELLAASRTGRGPAVLLDLNRRGRLVIDPFPLRLKMLLKVGKLF